VINKWFCIGVLCLKSQNPSTKLQINQKFQIPNGFNMIVFLFEILNLVIDICLLLGTCDLKFFNAMS